MALASGIQVTGLKEVRRACNKTGVGMEDLKAAHKRAADIVLRSALRRMPEVSGKLKDSYRATATKTTGKVHSTLVYAGVSEFGGTIPRFHSTKRTHHKPKAPNESYYVYPAIRENESRIVAEYEKEIDRIIRKHFGG